MAHSASLDLNFESLDLGDAEAPFVEAAALRSGPTILLVHGFLMSRAIWRDNLHAIGEIGRPVSLELLGHGRSPAPEGDAAYRVERYLHWFEEARRRLGVARWVVCGHSFGAALALNYALRHPDAVERVVVTNSLSAFDAVGGAAAAESVTALSQALLSQGASVLLGLPYHPSKMRFVSSGLRSELIDDSAALDAGAVEKAMRVTGPELGVSARLAELATPTLLVNGLREAPFQEARKRAAAMSPKIEVVDVDGGHSINAERPDAFNAALREFLGPLSAGEEKR